jgi:crotonobetainyl-CoA:carnitine CoA-transferase CaiB-like acyl-CoA transferase
MGPLGGVRVLDLTTTFSGPYCTLMLADLGAEVIKVETPEGDIARHLGASREPGLAAVFLNMNRGKKSAVLDLKSPEGREAIGKLLSTVDVLVHNMRPRAAERLGLSYPDCQRINPAVVYCAIPGFGSTGPSADRPAYDDIIQGASGMAALQSVNQDRPGYVVTPMADKIAGLTAAVALLAALRHRDLTGEGQRVEVPMHETMIAFGLLEQLDGWTFDPPTGPPLYPRTAAPNRRPYQTSDGHLCVMIYTESQWRRFFTLAGRAGVLEREEFDTVSKRIANADALYAIVASILVTRTTESWLAALEEIDVPCSPLASYEEILTDPPPGLVHLTEHPTAGRIRMIASPIAYSGTPLPLGAPAPRLGEHTTEILASIGMSDPAAATTAGEGAGTGADRDAGTTGELSGAVDAPGDGGGVT